MWHHLQKSDALKALVVAATAAIAVAGCAKNDAASANRESVVGVTMDSNGKLYVVERKSGKLRVCAYKYGTVEREWCKDLPVEP